MPLPTLCVAGKLGSRRTTRDNCRSRHWPAIVESQDHRAALLPIFKEGESDEEIMRWYLLTKAELDLLRQYYLDHTEECLATDRRIAAYMEEERNAIRRRGWQPMG